MSTTPPPCADLAKLFPELAAMSRSAYRLHHVIPSDTECRASRFGEPILWPGSKRWPFCREHRQPFIPVIQLFAADVPEIEFFPGADLLHLLWCPGRHKGGRIPGKPFEGLTGWVDLRIRWYNVAVIRKSLTNLPMATESQYGLVPIPGAIMAERVVEYPRSFTLPTNLRQALYNFDGSSFAEKAHSNFSVQLAFAEDFTELYNCQLSTCHGIKIGGHVPWIQHEAVPTCSWSRPMQYLLTVASDHCDSDMVPRWLPNQNSFGHGLMLGDCGSIHMFICKHCKDWPVRWVIDS